LFDSAAKPEIGSAFQRQLVARRVQFVGGLYRKVEIQVSDGTFRRDPSGSPEIM